MQSGDGGGVDDNCWIGNGLEEEDYQSIVDNESDYDSKYNAERDSNTRNIYGSFQESATAIAQLYKDKLNTSDAGAHWLRFQTAAGTVTTLYKDTCEGMRRTNEVASNVGYQRRSREIADWARNKRRRYIRREDLLAYLAGKSPPPSSTIHLTRVLPAHLIASSQQKSETISGQNHHIGTTLLGHAQHHYSHRYHPESSLESIDLHTFKEALVRRPRGPELYTFVASEIARHCKRPASPTLDVNMDVQNFVAKRQRFM